MTGTFKDGFPHGTIDEREVAALDVDNAERDMLSPRDRSGDAHGHGKKPWEDAAPLPLISGTELMKKEFIDQPLIDGLLDEGESLLVVGESGLGKSLFTLNLALRLAAPSPDGLWGFAVPRATSTLFVQAENSAHALQARQRQIIEAAPPLAQGTTRLHYAGARCRVVGDLSKPGFQRQLAKAVEKSRAGLLVLDPLLSFLAGDENSNSDAQRCLDGLSQVQNQTGVAVLVVHHRSKLSAGVRALNAGRGASAIGAWAANIVNLEPGPLAQGCKLIRCTPAKARNRALPQPWELILTPDLLLLSTQSDKERSEVAKARAVVEVLRQMGGDVRGQENLAKAVGEHLDCSPTTARGYIAKAVDLELVAKQRTSGPGGALSYSLPGEAR